MLATALIAAGLDGVKNKIKPNEPVDYDVGTLSIEEATEKNIELVPSSLEEAMDELERNLLMKEVFGPIWKEFISVKRSEAAKVGRYVTDWERNTLTQRF